MDLTTLPFELYQCILEFLNLPDVLRLRLVNKFFREVVREFRVQELCFYSTCENHEEIENFLYTSTPSVRFLHLWDIHCLDVYQPTNLISETRLHLLRNPLFKVEHLKRLEIYCLATDHRSYGITDDHINSLIHLEELRIAFRFHRTFAVHLKSTNVQNINWRLTLPKLKIFDLQMRVVKGSHSLNVDAPRLHSLMLFDGQNDCEFEIDHPASVKSLYVDKFRQNLLRFENVEELTIGRRFDGEQDLLSAFPQLRTLRITAASRKNFSYKRLAAIQREVRSNGRDLQIICYGIQLIDGHEFDGFDFERDVFEGYNNEKLFVDSIVQNFDKTEDNLSRTLYAKLDFHYIKRFAYENLANCLKMCKIPAGLMFKKFETLTKLEATSEIKNPKQLANFLAGCKFLGKLHLNNTELPQEFYDELPSITSLYDLEVRGAQCQDLNFRFVSRMFRLRRLWSDQHLMTAIQNGDLDMARFAGIDFITNKSDPFCGVLYRFEGIFESFCLKAFIKTGSYQHPYIDPDPFVGYFKLEKSLKVRIKSMSNQMFLDFYYFSTKFAPSKRNVNSNRKCKII